MYELAEAKANTSYELRDLANSLYKNFGEIEWARKLYKKSEDKAEAFFEFRWLADCLYEKLGDKEWAKRVYKKAAKTAKYHHQLTSLPNL